MSASPDMTNEQYEKELKAYRITTEERKSAPPNAGSATAMNMKLHSKTRKTARLRSA